MLKNIILFVGLAAICNGSALSGRIINGIPSAPDDAYAVTVFSSVGDGTFPFLSYLSTGVAVSSSVVVVTAQALYGYQSWRLGINSNNRQTQVTAETDTVSIHSLFDPLTLEFNVGVIRVNIPITAWLPIGPSIPDFPVLFGVGFGYANEVGNLPDVSQQSALHLIDFNDCRRQFNQRVVRPTNICATSVARLGNGDQGAPGVNFQRSEIYSIVSYWNPVTADHNPVVMTDLTHEDIQAFLSPYL